MPPSKFTPEIRKEILDMLSSGMAIIAVCRSLKLGYKTLCDWRNREEPEYVAFTKEFNMAFEEGLLVRKYKLENIVLFTALGKEAAEQNGINLEGANWQAACRMLEAIDAGTWVRMSQPKNDSDHKVTHTIVMKRKEPDTKADTDA